MRTEGLDPARSPAHLPATVIEFRGTSLPVRDDITRAHERAWARLACAGSWWTGEERVAIAAEARAAEDCAFCSEAKAALSPFSVEGEHTSVTQLPAPAIDAVHRVVRDSSRLTKSWVEKLASDGLTDAQYVELVGVVVTVMSIDGVCRGLGAALHPLPRPVPGEPKRVRPAPLEEGVAFVPMLTKALGDNADIFPGPIAPNVLRALSLVPDEVRQLRELGAAHYLPDKLVPAAGHAPGRALERSQIELVASRVSALNECFY